MLNNKTEVKPLIDSIFILEMKFIYLVFIDV